MVPVARPRITCLTFFNYKICEKMLNSVKTCVTNNIRVKFSSASRSNFRTSALSSVFFIRHNHQGPNPKFCIIGSGPAGFYAAKHLLKLLPSSQVDIYEKLPVPFGLVRYGVAPDHPEVKNVIHAFTTVLKSPNVNFVGNFEAGVDASLAQLKDAYHALLLAYGASEDRKLGIEGEKEYVLSAREFVGWYNGLPENRNLQVNLHGKQRAVIVGQGNVALDIARILLSPIDVLEKTDISPYALEALKKSNISEVVLCGRRGPMQAAFTIKELRELINLKDVTSVVNIDDFKDINQDKFLTALPRPKKRLMELLIKTAQNSDRSQANPDSKTWILQFLRSPKKIEKFGAKTRLTLGVNQFDPTDSEKVLDTGQEEVDLCDVVFRSIGYKGRRVFKELPFDEKTGVIPNTFGKVETGIYCCGWAGIGPRGVILTTMQNSFEVAKQIVQDTEKDWGQNKPGCQAIKPLVVGKSLTSYSDFAKIADFESKHNRKVNTINEMFSIINGHS